MLQRRSIQFESRYDQEDSVNPTLSNEASCVQLEPCDGESESANNKLSVAYQACNETEGNNESDTENMDTGKLNTDNTYSKTGKCLPPTSLLGSVT